MQKYLAFVLTSICILGLIGCSTKSMDDSTENEPRVMDIENTPCVIGIVEEVHHDYIILYSDTADGYPHGSRWDISLHTESKDSYTTPSVGDEIVVYHDGNVMESNPLRVGTIYAIALKTPADKAQTENDPALPPEDNTSGDIPLEKTMDFAVSYANWTEERDIYFGSLNKEKMAMRSVQHLPIYKFDTLEELEQFKHSFGEMFVMDYGYDEIPSFHEITADCDDAFFAENTLMLVWVGASSGTYRFGVRSVFCSENSFCIHIEQTNHPEVVTDDMAGWFITVAVPDSVVENCTEFDADLNHGVGQ